MTARAAIPKRELDRAFEAARRAGASRVRVRVANGALEVEADFGELPAPPPPAASPKPVLDNRNCRAG